MFMNANTFHGDFCVHLHFLSTVRHLLPSFEFPINARIEYFQKAGRYATDSDLVKNSADILPTEQLGSATIFDINKTLNTSSHTSTDNLAHCSVKDQEFTIGYSDTGCNMDDGDTECNMDCNDYDANECTIDYDDTICNVKCGNKVWPSVKSNEEQFAQTVSDLSSVTLRLHVVGRMTVISACNVRQQYDRC